MRFSDSSIRTPLFELGEIVATQGALRLFRETGTNPLDLLDRHVRGDWGNVCKEDAVENNLSVKEGFRILSSYRVGAETVWIITESSRALSTLLLKEEY